MVDEAAETLDYKARIREAMGIAENEEPTSEHGHALAKHASVTYQAAMKLLSWEGKTKSLSARNNSLAARSMKIDPDWLATGTGKMRSDRVWPFGSAIAPEDFFVLTPEEVAPAIDVLTGAINRKKLGGIGPSQKTGTHE